MTPLIYFLLSASLDYGPMDDITEEVERASLPSSVENSMIELSDNYICFTANSIKRKNPNGGNDNVLRFPEARIYHQKVAILLQRTPTFQIQTVSHPSSHRRCNSVGSHRIDVEGNKNR